MQCLQKHKTAELKYDGFADAVYWDDEIPDGLTPEITDLIRVVLRYRTTLLLKEPDPTWTLVWTIAKESFPNWIGFSEDRTTPNDRIAAFYEENAGLFLSDLDQLGDGADT